MISSETQTRHTRNTRNTIHTSVQTRLLPFSYLKRMSELHNFTLSGGYGSGFASANFEDAEDSRPSGSYNEALGGGGEPIQGIVQASMGRHLRESLPTTSPQLSALSAHTTNWRKHLREMMVKQNETVLAFLVRPSVEHSIIGPVEGLLRRYAIRQDVDTNSIRTFRDICDLSGAASIQEELATCVAAKGSSTLSEIKAQVNALIEFYKETGNKLLDAENQLKLRVEKMDKIQKRVATVIDLQTNEATPELVASLEKYLTVSFRDMDIESQYKSIVQLYQKHMALREAIQLFKVSHVTQEPLCPICLHDSIATAISPCGHTFCSTCAKRMATECGVCRGRIRDRLKLFFT